jgi:hypothetical protein
VFGLRKCAEDGSNRIVIETVNRSFYVDDLLTLPVTLTAKRILQMCCKLSLGWDDKLPEELLGFWEKWTSSLAAL